MCYSYWHSAKGSLVSEAQNRTKNPDLGESLPNVAQSVHGTVPVPPSGRTVSGSDHVPTMAIVPQTSIGLSSTDNRANGSGNDSGDGETNDGTGKPIAPRFSPEWLSAATRICDSPLTAAVHIDDACKALRETLNLLLKVSIVKGTHGLKTCGKLFWNMRTRRSRAIESKRLALPAIRTVVCSSWRDDKIECFKMACTPTLKVSEILGLTWRNKFGLTSLCGHAKLVTVRTTEGLRGGFRYIKPVMMAICLCSCGDARS